MAAVLFSMIVAFFLAKQAEQVASLSQRQSGCGAATAEIQHQLTPSGLLYQPVGWISGLFPFVLEPEQILIAALSALPVACCSSPEGAALLPARFDRAS